MILRLWIRFVRFTLRRTDEYVLLHSVDLVAMLEGVAQQAQDRTIASFWPSPRPKGRSAAWLN